MITRLILAGLLVAITPLPLLAQEQKNQNEGPPTLTVTGQGEASATPDRAFVRFGVEERGEQAAAVQDAVNKRMRAVLDAVKEAGIDEKQIQTSTVSLTPVPRHQVQGQVREAEVAGYVGSNSVQVEVSDIAKVGAVLDAAVKAGGNRIEHIWFDLKDDSTARAAAMTDAATRAKAKAEVLAAAMGLKLESIQSVTEGGDYGPPQPMAMRAMAAEMAQTPVQPGQVRVSASVTVKYRVSPGK